jgi:hypothetical protein
MQAHKEVLEGLVAFVKTERELTAGYIKEVHAALMQHIDTTARQSMWLPRWTAW